MTSAKTPGRPGRRRALRGVGLTLLAILLLAGVAQGLGWLWLTGAMTVGFSDWVAQQRARGWEVEHGLPERGGWPLTARLTVPDIRIAGWTSALPRGFIWEARQLDLTIAAPWLDRLVLTAQGPQRIRAGTLSLPYTAARLQAVVPLEHGPQPRTSELILEGLRAETPNGPLTAGIFHARATPGGGDGEPHLALQIDARQVGLPDLPDLAAFGREVESATVNAMLIAPPPPPMPMTPRDRAEAWHASSATLDLRQMLLRWGPLAGDLRMVLRLDAALQPVGQGQLTLEHPAQVVASLATAGLITPRAAMTAGAVLGMVARVPEGGGAPRVEVPVGVEDGTITLARIPLLRLRPITWPGESGHLR